MVVNFVTRTISPSEIADVLAVALPGLGPSRTASVVFYAAEPEAFAQLRPILFTELHLDPAAVEAQQIWPTTARLAPRLVGTSQVVTGFADLQPRVVAVSPQCSTNLDGWSSEMVHRPSSRRSRRPLSTPDSKTYR